MNHPTKYSLKFLGKYNLDVYIHHNIQTFNNHFGEYNNVDEAPIVRRYGKTGDKGRVRAFHQSYKGFDDSIGSVHFRDGEIDHNVVVHEFMHATSLLIRKEESLRKNFLKGKYNQVAEETIAYSIGNMITEFYKHYTPPTSEPKVSWYRKLWKSS